MQNRLLLLLLLVLAPACGEEDAVVVEDAAGTIMPTFALLDVNPASASYNRMVTPEEQRGAVSAWYFGSST